MSDTARELYERIARRKGEATSAHTYSGGNGRIDRAVDLILNEDFPRSGVLMDVGGATGNLGYALRDHFEERIVVDIVEDCRGPAVAKGNDFYRSDVDSNGLGYGPDSTVDLLVSLDFIEHIIDPMGFAWECHRVLKPSGRVLINTPNIQYWRHLESLVCRGVFPHTSGDQEVYHGGHTAFYNVTDLLNIFGQAGFSGFKMHTHGLVADPPPPIWMSLMSSYRGPFPVGVQLSYPDLVFSCKKD